MACEAVGTRCSRRNVVDAGLERQVATVERLIRELRAGLKIDQGGLKPWEREGIAWWSEIEETFRRADARRTRDLHELLLERAQAGH